MNEILFLKTLEHYMLKYFQLCEKLDLPESVLTLSAYNVERLYRIREFDGYNMHWDFVFTCNLWLASKVIMDEDYTLEDMCDLVPKDFTTNMFLDLEYIMVQRFNFDFGAKFIRDLYNETKPIEIKNCRERIDSKGSRGSISSLNSLSSDTAFSTLSENDALIKKESTFDKDNHCNIY